MGTSLVWISGASSGIGAALARTVPWPGSRVIGISRRAPEVGEHLEVDLADPASWTAVWASFAAEMEGFEGERAVFVHAAGTLEPVGFAGEVDSATYAPSVLLNSAAPQVLGHLFLAAAHRLDVERHLVLVTSGAASNVYAGWTAYGAGKAAVDQWARNAGAEQEIRGGVRVLAVAPGTVATDMQARLRDTDEADFPQRQMFVDLHEQGQLTDPDDVARQLWSLLGQGLDNGSVVDLRQRDGDGP